jgi:hypothetical protein
VFHIVGVTVFWDKITKPENTPVMCDEYIESERKSKKKSASRIAFMRFFIKCSCSPFSSESGEVYFFTLFSYGDANHLLLLESSDNDIISLI